MNRLTVLFALLVMFAGCREKPRVVAVSLAPSFVLDAPRDPGNAHPEIAIHPEGTMLAYKMPKSSNGLGTESFQILDLKTRKEVFDHGVGPWKIPALRSKSEDGQFQVLQSEDGDIAVFATKSRKRTVLITVNDHRQNEQGWRLANMGIAITHHQGVVTIALAGCNSNKRGDGAIKIWVLNEKDLE